MSEITDKYRDACRRLNDAHEAVINVCQHVVLLADMLRKAPQEVHIGGISGAIGIAAPGVAFDATNWPTPIAIQNALAEYHMAVGGLRVAWTNVRGHNEHHGLAPPAADPWEAMRKEFLRRVNLPPR